MQIPMIKTLLRYRQYPREIKVLCDYFAESDDKYGYIDFQHKLHARNPFDDMYELHSEIRPYSDGNFVIEYFDKEERVAFVDCIVTHVLEYDGKIFKLEELEYDLKENDY